MTNIMDRLYDRVRERSNICVGLDTKLDYIPHSDRHLSIGDQLFNFNRRIIDETADLVACFKPQIAYYEAHGMEGLLAYKKTVEYLRNQDLLIIGDIKRSDIASTAEMYAEAHFEGDFEADFITLNPYMGFDSIEPYLPYFNSGEKGAFVLLRTSNPGAKDIEMLEHKGEPLFMTVGRGLQEMSEEINTGGKLSPLGLVVGATHEEEAEKIRSSFENMFFLIPGYGAQGGTSDIVRKYLDDDLNMGVINSSRGIITHFKKYDDGEEKIGAYAREAVLNMKRDIYGK